MYQNLKGGPGAHTVRTFGGKVSRVLLRTFAASAISICLFSIYSTSYAQSLNSELTRLIQIHPQIEEQRTILRRAQESVTTARSGYYPNVSLTGSYGSEITSNPTTRLTNDDNDALLFNALGIEVRQTLFNRLQTDNSVDAAIMARDSVAFAMNSTVQTVMLQGITSYINILRLNELIRVSRARERTIRQQMDLETARVERGAGIEVDVLQAKSRLQIAIEQRVDLEGQLRQAEAAYVQAFQRQPDITRMRLDPPPMDMVPASLDEALFMSREENPLVRAREFLSRSARFTIDATRSGYYPTFEAVARWDHEYNVSHVRDDVKKSAILIEMSWDLFAGFATNAAVASAQESLLASFAVADRTLHQVERQVRTAWIKLENTRQRKELLLNAVSIAQEVFVARQRQREAGRETTQNVLDAESEVFQAEQNLIRADYDARIAVYELVAAMGVLTPALLGIDVEVIEDIDQYFSAEDDVRDLAPIEEIEARRREIEEMRAQGQRDSLIPEPGLISPGSETEDNLVDPATDAAAGSDGTVIEPPPEPVPQSEVIESEQSAPIEVAPVDPVEEEVLEESRSNAPAGGFQSVSSESGASGFDVQDSSLPFNGDGAAQSLAVPELAPAAEVGPAASESVSAPVSAAADAPVATAPEPIEQPVQEAGSTDFISGVRRLLGFDSDEVAPVETLGVGSNQSGSDLPENGLSFAGQEADAVSVPARQAADDVGARTVTPSPETVDAAAIQGADSAAVEDEGDEANASVTAADVPRARAGMLHPDAVPAAQDQAVDTATADSTGDALVTDMSAASEPSDADPVAMEPMAVDAAEVDAPAPEPASVDAAPEVVPENEPAEEVEEAPVMATGGMQQRPSVAALPSPAPAVQAAAPASPLPAPVPAAITAPPVSEPVAPASQATPNPQPATAAPAATAAPVSYPFGASAGGVAVDGDSLITRPESNSGFDVPGMTLFGDAQTLPVPR